MKTAIITASLIACFALLAFAQPEQLYIVREVKAIQGRALVTIQNLQTGVFMHLFPTNYADFVRVNDTCDEQLRKKPYKK